MHKRLSTSVPISVIILFIWLTAGIFAIPNVAFNRVVQLPLTKLSRCRTVYPANELTIRRFITLFTFLSQYAIPLSITAFAYIRISFYVWHKLTEPTESCSSASTFSTEKMNGQQEYMEQSLASVPHSQLGSLKRTCYYQANVIQLRDRSRRKTIKMLSLVVACFAISWFVTLSHSQQALSGLVFILQIWLQVTA